MNQFIIFWKDGEKEVIEGIDEKDAFKNAGLSAGAIPAVDFIGTSNDENKYEFDGETWRNKEILELRKKMKEELKEIKPEGFIDFVPSPTAGIGLPTGEPSGRWLYPNMMNDLVDIAFQNELKRKMNANNVVKIP